MRFDFGRGQSSWGIRDARRVCWVSELRFLLWARQSSWGLAMGDVGTVSIVKFCLSLSSCWKTKLKKLINVSYLNYRESSVFRISLHLNILHILISAMQQSLHRFVFHFIGQSLLYQVFLLACTVKHKLTVIYNSNVSYEINCKGYCIFDFNFSVKPSSQQKLFLLFCLHQKVGTAVIFLCKVSNENNHKWRYIIDLSFFLNYHCHFKSLFFSVCL